MKKIMFSLAIIALTAILFSCSSDKNESIVTPVNVSVTTVADTTIFVEKQTPVTAKRYSCDGKALKYPKLLSMETSIVPVNISMTRTGEGVVDCPAGIVSAGGWDWSNFWKILAAIAGIALLVWFLWWLFNQIPERNQRSQSSSETTSSDVNPNEAAELAAAATLATAIGEAGGGLIRRNRRDFTMIINGVDSPLVSIVNSGTNSKSGNVDIQIGDNTEPAIAGDDFFAKVKNIFDESNKAAAANK